MSYFVEINDGKTYAGHDDDFHFMYNANTGGGQSFLGGKFVNEAGDLVSPATLNGRIGIFRFALSGVVKAKDVVLDEADTQYEIKPRAAGDNNMKLSVGAKPTPSAVISTFLMLPETCGVKRSENIKASALCGGNFWVHSMWMSATLSSQNRAIMTLRDCVLCGGVDKNGQGQARYFAVDFKNRISDIISISEAGVPDAEIQTCIDYFADIYKGVRPFVYSEASTAVNTLMSYMAGKYPTRYSGLIDPMAMICQFVKRRFAMQDGIHQLITYGAPGTGKSFRTKEETKRHAVYRTTFHPDSDYSTFVGAYKPTMKAEQRINCIDDKAKAVKDANGDPSMQNVIAYDFVPQAFIKAYVDAWQKMDAVVEGETPDPVFLVIEEINRGNCAQIFGDLFQLLDRGDDGFSDYPIDTDADLKRFLSDAKQLGNLSKIREEVRTGVKLVLPPNLYIRATMNTSDQSLFPIDSAFKRRWEWKYVPIARPTEAGWTDRVIVADGKAYDWWEFLKIANKQILDTTKSEDKQLGYFFVKAPDATGHIKADRFAGKVLFYLYNDVFKDYTLPAALFGDGSGGSTKYEFKMFFDEHGEPKEKIVAAFLEQLGLNATTINPA